MLCMGQAQSTKKYLIEHPHFQMRKWSDINIEKVANIVKAYCFSCFCLLPPFTNVYF